MKYLTGTDQELGLGADLSVSCRGMEEVRREKVDTVSSEWHEQEVYHPVHPQGGDGVRYDEYNARSMCRSVEPAALGRPTGGTSDRHRCTSLHLVAERDQFPAFRR